MPEDVPDYVPPLTDDYIPSSESSHTRRARTASEIAFLAKDFGPDLPSYSPTTLKSNPRRKRPDSRLLHVIQVHPETDEIITFQKMSPPGRITFTSRQTRYLVFGIVITLAAAAVGGAILLDKTEEHNK